MDYVKEDLGLIDLTTYGLEIGHKKGIISFEARYDMILSGLGEVEKILQNQNLNYELFAKNSQQLKAGQIILKATGYAKELHSIWKVCQNILEYSSGIASYTHDLVQRARKHNEHINIATTRKNMPSAKKLMVKAVVDGGGVIHRLGLYDSILIFAQHLEFMDSKEETEEKILKLKRKFDEKKIAIEVDGYDGALYFAKLGVDILQCEKMSIDELKRCVELKKSYPGLRISATGGITEKNVEDFAKSGVDFLVTSSPYHAKPKDVKVRMKKL